MAWTAAAAYAGGHTCKAEALKFGSFALLLASILCSVGIPISQGRIAAAAGEAVVLLCSRSAGRPQAVTRLA